MAYLRLHIDAPLTETDTPYLRGFFGNAFRDIPLFHHHLDETGYLYVYPRIQYKIIGGDPLLVGIAEGVSALQKAIDALDHLRINGTVHAIKETTFSQTIFEPKPTAAMREYTFVTPWLALNQRNTRLYNELHEHAERKNLLNSILVANILSFCKGVGIVCRKRLEAHSHLDATSHQFKGIPMTAFSGSFRINFLLPDLIGIGKAVSFGNGTIRRAGMRDDVHESHN